MVMEFSKATKRKAKLRLALIGVSGSGKTYTALNIAKHLGGKAAVIDTERGSASKYADLFNFDVLELEQFNPMTYVEAIKAAEAAGYDILIIDSLSHAWFGKEGALEQVDKAAKRMATQNSFAAWRDVTPMHNALVDKILQSSCHVIATMRAKSEYSQEKDERGKTVIRKVGLAPIQRDGVEYEFDVVADMNIDNELVVSKSRCPSLTGQVIQKPGKEIAETLKAWLTDGVEPEHKPAPDNHKPQAEPKPAPQPEPTPTATRTPAMLVAVIRDEAKKWEGKPISVGKRGLVVSCLEACFDADQESRRKDVQKYLTGKLSTKDIPDNELIAIYQWLQPSQDNGGGWSASPQAQVEARNIYAETLRAGGAQASLI